MDIFDFLGLGLKVRKVAPYIITAGPGLVRFTKYACINLTFFLSFFFVFYFISNISCQHRPNHIKQF